MEVEDYYAADVEARYGVTPQGFIDLKALMGDASDNIPGVPKVGEKTAAELMKQFGSLDGIYAHVEEVTKKAVRESLIANKDLAYLSRTLAAINVDSPLDFSLEEARIGNLFTPQAYEIFRKLEFKNMLSRFEDPADAKKEDSERIRLVDSAREAEDIFRKVKEAQACGFMLLEDEKDEIRKVFIRWESLGAKITRTIEIPVFTNKELVAFGESYAQERDCVLDEMAVLALYNRIGNSQTSDHLVNVAEVKEMVDEAIERRGKKGLFGKTKRSRMDEFGHLILLEKDFEN